MIRIKNGSLFQWDINRIIEADDSENKICAIHCCQEGDEDALLLPFSRNGNKVEATIPNIFLQSAKSIYIYVVYQINEEVKTEYCKALSVIARQKPDDYIYEETEVLDYNLLKTQIMQAVENKADLDDTGKLNSKHLPENIVTSEKLTAAVSTAISQAKENGEINGEKGDKGDRGEKGEKGDAADMIDPQLNLLVLGDSIFGKAVGKNWLKTLGCNIQNYAVSGASIAEISEKKRINGDYNTLLDQLGRFKESKAPMTAKQKEQTGWTATFDKPDAVLLCGGGNDYLSASVLGDVTAGAHTYANIYKDATYDKSTVVGALHTLLREISMTYPEAQRFFLIMHRVYQCLDETFFTGSRKSWPVKATYARVPYTREVDGKTVTTWELLLDEDGNRLTTAADIKAAESIHVREFYDGTENNEGYIRYSNATDFDPKSIYSSGTHPGGTLDTSKFQGRYTYNELYDVIVKVCGIYGFKVIDIYNDSPLNVMPPDNQMLEAFKIGEDESGDDIIAWHYRDYSQLNDNGEPGVWTSTGWASWRTLYSNPIKLANTRYLDWKGIHPTKLGYEIGYDPYVRDALHLGKKN